MRILVVVALLLAACSKKPAPKTPANSAVEQEQGTGPKDNAAPGKTDDADKNLPTKSTSDPCDGHQ